MDSPSPRPTAGRRFTLLDGMILVGVVAVVLAPTRWIDLPNLIRYITSDFAWEWGFFDQVVAMLLVYAAIPAMAMTLGVLAMRLRQPRPRWRRLIRQPGLVACLAQIAGGAAAGAFCVVNVLSIDGPETMTMDELTYAQDPFNWLLTFSNWCALLGGFAVVVAWATLLLVGRWHAEPTWLDRLGRLVGLAWVALSMVAWFVMRSAH